MEEEQVAGHVLMFAKSFGLWATADVHSRMSKEGQGQRREKNKNCQRKLTSKNITERLPPMDTAKGSKDEDFLVKGVRRIW